MRRANGLHIMSSGVSFCSELVARQCWHIACCMLPCSPGLICDRLVQVTSEGHSFCPSPSDNTQVQLAPTWYKYLKVIVLCALTALLTPLCLLLTAL